MLEAMSPFKKERLRASVQKKFRRYIRAASNYIIDVDGEEIPSSRIMNIKVLSVQFVGTDGITARVQFTIRGLGLVIQEIDFGLNEC
jgi:hypothetical protein